MFFKRLKSYLKKKIINFANYYIKEVLRHDIEVYVKEVLIPNITHHTKEAIMRDIERYIREGLSHDISYELQIYARKETTEYVKRNMSKIISVQSRWEVLDVALNNMKIEGLICEFGVFYGESINYIADKVYPKLVYGFDSFQGLPETWRDGFPKGCFNVNGIPQVRDNVKLIVGWFHETLPKFLEETKLPFAFIHVDCDLYSSTKTIFDLAYDRIVPGTVIVFDEYFNYPGWEDGEYKAFQEFIKERNMSYEYITYNRLHEQVAVLIK